MWRGAFEASPKPLRAEAGAPREAPPDIRQDCVRQRAEVGGVVADGQLADGDARGGTYATLFRLQAESYR